jgi:hypothetical protein
LANLGADDEILVGVERLASADDRVPIAGRLVFGLVFAGRVRVAGKEMGNEDGIVAPGVELAVALVAEPDVLQGLAADGGVGRHGKGLLLDRSIVSQCQNGVEQQYEGKHRGKAGGIHEILLWWRGLTDCNSGCNYCAGHLSANTSLLILTSANTGR